LKVRGTTARLPSSIAQCQSNTDHQQRQVRNTMPRRSTKPRHRRRRDVMRSRQSSPLMWFVFLVGTLVLGFRIAGTVSAGQAKDVPICKLKDQGYVLRMVTQKQYDQHIAADDGEWKALETFYIDKDGDGYGTTTVRACAPTAGLAIKAGDCNDND